MKIALIMDWREVPSWRSALHRAHTATRRCSHPDTGGDARPASSMSVWYRRTVCMYRTYVQTAVQPHYASRLR